MPGTMHVKLSDQLMQFFEEVSKAAISDVERGKQTTSGLENTEYIYTLS